MIFSLLRKYNCIMKKYHSILIRILFTTLLFSCVANKDDYNTIETSTNLTTIEIVNYYPNNTNSISNGYVKYSINKIDHETFPILKEIFKEAETNNSELYFDSLGYETIKKLGNLESFNQNQQNNIVNRELSSTTIINYHKSKKDNTLMGVVVTNNKKIIISLETTTIQDLNRSNIKIWHCDNVKKIPQIRSVLEAKNNYFNNIKIIDNNLLLSDGNFIYKIVLDEDYRFSKNMKIFVSTYE